MALWLQLPWSVARVAYDAAVTLFHAPLPGACGGYKAAALLALSASVFTSAIAVLLFYLLASRHAHALD